jgi:predicted DNA-binding protein with PD1-like motif
MQFKKYGERYLLRLEVGEEIIETIKEFCTQRRIGSGKMTGIGVLRKAQISYYDLALRDFHHREIFEYVELTSLMGNISIMEGQVFPHLHVTLSDAKFNVYGGHLSSGEIGVTGEFVIEPFNIEIERKLYQETGFRLLVLEDD